jgi:hypothetical protein
MSDKQLDSKSPQSSNDTEEKWYLSATPAFNSTEVGYTNVKR